MKRAVLFLAMAVAVVICNFKAPKRIIVAGSSCMGKMTSALAQSFENEYGIKVEAQLGGTQLGLMALQNGVCDIASVSRQLSEQELCDVEAFYVAIDAIAVIVNKENTICNINLEQLTEIYSGKIKNWSELGGDDMPIVVIGREAGSGTREAFEKAIRLSSYAAHSQEHSETGMLRTAVAMTKGAIGYISFDYVNQDVKGVLINNIGLTRQSVINGSYPILRSFAFCIKRGEKDSEIKRFINYSIGERGRKILEQLHMMPFQREPQAKNAADVPFAKKHLGF